MSCPAVTTYLEHYSNFAKVSVDASFLAGIIMVSARKEQTLNPKTTNTITQYIDDVFPLWYNCMHACMV